MYRSYYQTLNLRSQVKRARSPRQESPKTVTAETVWAAAAYAHRVNGGEYFKEPRYKMEATGTYTNEVAQQANRWHMWQAIEDESPITEADRELGRRVRDWAQKDLVVKTLKGTARDFDVTMGRVVEMDDFITTVDRYEISLVCSRPRAYEDAQQLEQAMEGISREPLAPVGERVDETVTVAKSIYSQNYGVYFITAVTGSRHAVFFSYRERLAVGHQCRIRGTVKAHRDNSTQLNRVRMV